MEKKLPKNFEFLRNTSKPLFQFFNLNGKLHVTGLKYRVLQQPQITFMIFGSIWGYPGKNGTENRCGRCWRRWKKCTDSSICSGNFRKTI